MADATLRQIIKGYLANLPTLLEGQLAYVIDTMHFYFGTASSGTKIIATQDDVATVATSVSEETTRAEAEENILAGAISTEQSRAEDVEAALAASITSAQNLTTETNQRMGADLNLQAMINGEAGTRGIADANLLAMIQNALAVPPAISQSPDWPPLPISWYQYAIVSNGSIGGGSYCSTNAQLSGYVLTTNDVDINGTEQSFTDQWNLGIYTGRGSLPVPSGTFGTGPSISLGNNTIATIPSHGNFNIVTGGNIITSGTYRQADGGFYEMENTWAPLLFYDATNMILYILSPGGDIVVSGYHHFYGWSMTVVQLSATLIYPQFLMNDEFTSGTLGGIWTVQNQSTKIVTLGNSRLNVTVPAAAIADDMTIFTQPIPAGTAWIFTTKFTIDTKSVNYQIAGMVLRDSASGHMITFLNGNTGAFSVDHFSTLQNGYVSNPWTLSLGNFPTVYFRIRLASSTYYFGYSFDGINFLEFYSEAVGNYITANQIGLMVDINNNTVPFAASFDFFRKVA